MQAIKDKTEAQTKVEIQDFIRQYRYRDEHHKGVASKDFRAIAAKAGVEVPPELLAGTKKERSTGQL